MPRLGKSYAVAPDVAQPLAKRAGASSSGTPSAAVSRLVAASYAPPLLAAYAPGLSAHQFAASKGLGAPKPAVRLTSW